jgi:hypothetical protein
MHALALHACIYVPASLLQSSPDDLLLRIPSYATCFGQLCSAGLNKWPWRCRRREEHEGEKTSIWAYQAAEGAISSWWERQGSIQREGKVQTKVEVAV